MRNIALNSLNISVGHHPFGMIMPGRSFSSGSYRYGFGGHEKDDEVKGSGNHLSFRDYGYDSRLGRRWRVDPKITLLPNLSPYSFSLNNPLNVIDPDGEFPILVNGKVGSDKERASSTYWDSKLLATIADKTGYAQADFSFVDGDQGFWPSSRSESGAIQGILDAQEVWNKMKESMNEDGEITEQLQVITHSRGSVYGAAYMESLATEIQALAEDEGIGFAYDKNSIIEYSVNLAPHQSNYIDYYESGTINVNISHRNDPLSGNDATGNVTNVHSDLKVVSADGHGNKTFVDELNFVLDALENNSSKADANSAIKEGYKKHDSENVSAEKAKVTIKK